MPYSTRQLQVASAENIKKPGTSVPGLFSYNLELAILLLLSHITQAGSGKCKAHSDKSCWPSCCG